MGTQRHHRPEGHRAVGYLRRSTDRQEQSIDDQKRALEAYASEHGLRLGKFYIDDAISGTSTVGRRAFQQMMQDAQKPEHPFFVAFNVQNRNPWQTAAATVFQACGDCFAVFHFVNVDFDHHVVNEKL